MGLEGKAWGADLPKSPVMLNPQFKGAQPIDVFVVPVGRWTDGSAVRLCRTITSRSSAIVNLTSGTRKSKRESKGFHHERPRNSGSEGHCT